METGRKTIFVEGQNCWKTTRASRVAFLIDGESYFKAFHQTALKAKQSILIMSWDINSRILLRHDADRSGFPQQLGPFLQALLERRPDLTIKILNWDFSIFYMFDRGTQPLFNFGLQGHRRLRFKLDRTHPIGASHHQKIVVVDDSVAFAGGFDLSHSRWDTPDHAADDLRRTDPNGTVYGPFHDIQIMVDGDTAKRLGDLARERWYLATGEYLPHVTLKEDLWPSDLNPDMEDVSLAISRTLPAFMGRPEVYEVQALYLDMIASARRFIYIESQYFTSVRIEEALAARLLETDGPEILMILPLKNSGWLEENSMGLLRAGLLGKLRQADVHGRLGIYYPVVPDREDLSVNVHSKIMVIDDRMARVGSSNLSNRSMGLDTECDLTIESEELLLKRDQIARFRNRLLAEHLDVSPEKIAQTISSKNSLLGAVEFLRGSGRTLRPMVVDSPEWLNGLLPDSAFFDLERPLDKERLIEEFVPSERKESAGQSILRGGLILLLLIVLAGLWKWSPLKDWVDLRSLLNWAESFRQSPMALPMVIAAYLTGGLVMFPVTLLILATVFTFDPFLGIIYSLAGCFSSAMVGYGLGRVIGQNFIRRLAGIHLDPMSRRLARHGLEAIVFLRIVPALPFTVVNLLGGASHLSFKVYLLGTGIGMAPGIFLLALFQTSLEKAVLNPEPLHFLMLIVIALVILLATWLLTRWINIASRVKLLYARLRKRRRRRGWFRGKNQQTSLP